MSVSAKARDGGYHEAGIEKQSKVEVAGRVNVDDKVLTLFRTTMNFYICTLKHRELIDKSVGN